MELCMLYEHRVTFHFLATRTSRCVWNVDGKISPSQIANVEVQEMFAVNLGSPNIVAEELWRRGRVER